jgi:RHS repeat-associated protein
VTSVSDNNSDYAYTYDAANQLTSVDNSGTPDVPDVVLDYTYDGAGNRTSLTDSLGGVTSYTYDSRNELSSLSQSGTGVASKLIDYAYDQAGNMTAMTRYSDLTGTSEVAATAYTYDNANRLTAITHETSGAALIASYAYTLDAADRVTEEVKSWTSGGSTVSDTLDYSYTANNQLTGVTHTDTSFAAESFSDDANGNPTDTGDVTDTGNELTSDGTYDYSYDADGNLITRTDIATGDETTYAYDFRNRLTAVDQVVGGVTTVLATYTYDALDRRIGTSEGGATTWTVYDGTGTDPLLDFDGSGTQTARYLDGPTAAGVDAVLARETPSGGVAWYLTDRLGSVGDLVDNSGAVLDHIDYTAFGTPTQSTPSEGDRFEYAGLDYDPATGLNLAVHRAQDPATGRWISQDPIGFIGGDTDLYRYAGNNPLNSRDPSGLEEPGGGSTSPVPQPGQPGYGGSSPGQKGPTGQPVPGFGGRKMPKHDPPSRPPNQFDRKTPNRGRRSPFSPPPPVDPKKYPGEYRRQPDGNDNGEITFWCVYRSRYYYVWYGGWKGPYRLPDNIPTPQPPTPPRPLPPPPDLNPN